ncbi:MAG: cyanophycinase [Myxococcota bacterium]
MRVALVLLLVLGCTTAPPDGDATSSDAGATSGTDAGTASDTGSRRGFVALVGGGSEEDPGVPDSWSEAAYGWVVERSGGGDVMVVAATAQTEWIPNYFRTLGARDAFNVLVESTADADDPALSAQVDAVDAVFLKGGDQWRYVSSWRNTAFLDALHRLYARGGVLAGTSAGGHVLSEVVFDAREGSLYPEDAIRNARAHEATFTEDFLHVLPGTLMDSHVGERGRLFRMAALLALHSVDHPDEDTVVIGVDARTALLVEPDLQAHVVGEGTVILLHRDEDSVVHALDGAPPVATGLRMDVMAEGGTVDLTTRAVTPTSNATTLQVPANPLSATPLTLDGEAAATNTAGSAELVGEDGDPDALSTGGLQVRASTGPLQGAVVVGNALVSSEHVENRVGGVLWALGQGGLGYGVLVDGNGGSAVVDGAGVLRAGSGAPSVLVVDVREVTAVAPSPRPPRQTVTLVGARLHLVAGSVGYRVTDGTVVR